MKFTSIFSVLLALSFLFAGCTSMSRIYPDTDAFFKGTGYDVPREFKNGTATLTNVYAWTASLLGTNSALHAEYRDVDSDGQDELLLSQPAYQGTGGNAYLFFKQTPKGYRFLGDLGFGSLQVLSPDTQGHPRVLTSSSAGSGTGREALCYLDGDGFHEIISRMLPGGDSAFGHDQLAALLGEIETKKSVTDKESVLRLVFGDPDTTNFSGSIAAGQRFERPFGGRFIFAFEPTRYGWEIQIHEQGQTNDLARRAFPEEGISTTSLEGWHFRNEDNTGPSHVSSDVMMASERKLIFSPEANELDSMSPGQTNLQELWQTSYRIAAFGQGEFTVSKMKLSPPQPQEKAAILKMHFECKLTWRRKNLEELYNVQAGDTLFFIAKRSGMSLAELESVNPQLAHRAKPALEIGAQLLVYKPER